MQKPIQALMQKEMTRKEFLATVGFGAAAVMGMSHLLTLLGKKNPFQQGARLGYGANTYGGIRKG
jgi:hypothetical protein